MRLFVFGHGYSAGRYVATRDPQDVAGVTVRDPEKAKGLEACGLPVFLFDGNSEDDLADRPGDDGKAIEDALARTTHLLVSVPPGHDAPTGARVGGANAAPGDPVLARFGETIRSRAPALAWIGYLSTVGVYGDHGGEWVNEAGETRPVSARSRARLAAEAGWRELAEARAVPLAILRLSGIYGPGRNAFVSLAAGRAKRLVKPGQVFNRIHVNDIAGALELLAHERRGGIYNVTDDEPAPPQDVVALAAKLAGVEPPPEIAFEEAELTPMARSFYGENKRVSNRSIKDAGYALLYPTYREGLEGLKAEARKIARRDRAAD